MAITIKPPIVFIAETKKSVAKTAVSVIARTIAATIVIIAHLRRCFLFARAFVSGVASVRYGC